MDFSRHSVTGDFSRKQSFKREIPKVKVYSALTAFIWVLTLECLTCTLLNLFSNQLDAETAALYASDKVGSTYESLCHNNGVKFKGVPSEGGGDGNLHSDTMECSHELIYHAVYLDNPLTAMRQQDWNVQVLFKSTSINNLVEGNTQRLPSCIVSHGSSKSQISLAHN